MVNEEFARVLLTGASGFIGRRLTAILLERGFRVRALYRSNDISNYFESPANGQLEVTQGDISDPTDIARIVSGCDAVIHAAGLTIDWGPFEDFKAHNYTAAVNLVHAAEEAGCSVFLYISSASVHGFGTHVSTTEEGPFYPLKYPYPQTKKMAEEYLITRNRPGFRVTVIRPGNAYGPGDRTSTYEMYRQITRGTMGYIGGGRYYTCPVFIDDLCGGIITALSAEAAAGEVIIISDGQKVTWKEYTERMFEAAGSAKKPVNLPVGVAYAAAGLLTAVYRLLGIKKPPALTLYRVEQAAHHYHFDNSKARRLLGFEPTVFFREGLRITAEAFFRDEEKRKAGKSANRGRGRRRQTAARGLPGAGL